MLSDKMNSALNEQINAEMFSSYLYLSMSGWFESKGLSGFASWMRTQVQEETMHSEKFFEDALGHEQMISGCVNNLVDLALEEKDHASNNFLQWFVAEQVEEEATAGSVVDGLKLIQDDSAGLFALDLEMGKRSFDAAT